MLKLLNSIVGLSMITSVPVEQSIWLENGKPASAYQTRASNGVFGAVVVLTDDWEAFNQRWNQSTPGFEIPVVNSIQKGHPLMSAVIFTGCKPDQAANCRVTADFQVIDPKGKIYADRKDANIWNGQPAPGKHLQLSMEGLGLSLDPPDPLGTYVVKVRVTDQIANKTLLLRTTFTAK